MSQWHNSESGILRKNKKKDNFEDLLVFGYACKVFRDDEKALYIDQGKHLIPWMGDEKLKIDRYDCRGHLSDLNRFEASREGYDAMRWLGLDENERKLEQLCDEERYYSLRINEEEEQMYKEEEDKRNKTNAFQYSYDVPTNPETQEGIPTVPEYDEDEKYVPPPELDVPVDIAIPKTVKENARIEKTAMFVSAQGPQMEILIKAKQNDNPQFSFLNQNDPLYKFYRHVLNAIKNGRYQIRSTRNDQSTASTSSNSIGGESGDHYLHPSLISSTNSNTEQPIATTTTIPSVPYKPSANCAYSQLVNRIQGTKGQIDAKEQADTEQKVENNGNFTYEQQQQYYQYYMQQQYYEYYKHMTQNSGAGDELPDKPMDSNMQAYIQQMMYAHYLQQTQQSATNSYAQIVSNVNKDAPASEPNLNQEPSNLVPQSNNEETTKKPSVLSLIQSYGSDTDSSYDDDDDQDLKIPEDETKIVIDKMASYVIKNGPDFENIVKSRADPRFEFLNENHEFHKYYRKKVNEEKKKKECDENEKLNKTKEKKVIAPVSFSIKKPKDDHPKEIKSALPIDEDTDEEEQTNNQENSSNSTQRPTSANNSNRIIFKSEKDSTFDETKIHSNDVREVLVEEKEPQTNTIEDVDSKPNGQTEIPLDDPILEMIDLTEDILDDKIEKLDDTINSTDKTNIKENRALQLERRRKAMAFLKMKSVKSSSESVMSENVPTIDLSEVGSPKRTQGNDDNEHDKMKEKNERHKHKKSRRDNKKDRGRSRHSRSPIRYETSDNEIDYTSSNSDENVKHRKSSHRRKRAHKRKHSKSSHSKSRKKSKKKEKSSSSSESDR